MRIYLAAILLSALAACSGGTGLETGQTQTFQEIRTSFRQAIKRPSGPRPPLPKLSRAFLDSLPNPALEAVLEDRDASAYLDPLQIKGNVTVWSTTDLSQLITRDGLVTGTRGLGSDIVSSSYAQTLAALAARGGMAQRRLNLTNDLDQSIQVSLSCQIRDVGPETLEIVELTFSTRHLLETCTYSGGTIVNDYWTDSSDSGKIWKSRQWLGPEIGWIKLRLFGR
ncbi:MAG: YjbF family lipoprotein [Paracoccaceae bacterium]